MSTAEGVVVPSLPLHAMSQGTSIEQMIKDFEDRGVLPPQSQRSHVLQHLTTKRIKASNEQRYLDAAKFLNLYKKLRQAYLDEKTVKTKRQKTTKNPESNLTDIKRRIALTNQKYIEKKNKYENKRDETIRLTKEQHWSEIKKFRKYWNNPASLVQYAKPSYQLQQLRVRERKQAIIQDYEGAEATKILADKLAKKETKEAQKRAEEAMNKQYEAMLQRQEKEIKGIELHYKRKLATLEKEYNEKSEQLQLGLKWQEIEKEELIRKTAQVSTYTNAKVLYQEPLEDEPSIEEGAMTPRTFQELVERRNTAKADLLPLQGIDI